MHEVKSVSVLIGIGKCNAKCKHCAGLPIRKYAPSEDGIIDEYKIENLLVDCHARGARSFSISSSGEPTLSPKSVTKVLEIVDRLARKGIFYKKVNLYTNGILIGSDKKFCNQYLRVWMNLGLTTVYVTVHSSNIRRNAKVYNVSSYPELYKIVDILHEAGIRVRANVILSKEGIGLAYEFDNLVKELLWNDFDKICAWSIRDPETDSIDKELCPDIAQLDLMEDVIRFNKWEDKVALYRELDRSTYEKGEKLTLFPNGVLSNSWCN